MDYNQIGSALLIMSNFRFYYPIEVRYGDLDPQGHVNNARYLTYMEQTRIAYVRHLGLWPGGSFLTLGIILADVQITFRKPILFGQPVQVGARVSRLGNKSLTMDYTIEHTVDNSLFASSTSVLVTYEYGTGQTIAIPNHWRSAIAQFEELEPD